MQPPYMNPQNYRQPHNSSRKTWGIIFLVIGFFLVMLGICSLWMLGLGIIPLLMSIPFFIVALILII